MRGRLKAMENNIWEQWRSACPEINSRWKGRMRMLHNVHPCAGKYCSKSWGCRFHYQAPCDRRSGYIGFSLFPERHFPFLSNNSSWQPCHAELGKIPAGQPISKQGQDRLHLQVYNRTPIQACQLLSTHPHRKWPSNYRST
jgi:hypothetical protein